MKLWHKILIVTLAVLFVASLSVNIFLLLKNTADPSVPRMDSKLSERMAYILDYYDIRMDYLEQGLEYKSEYFTPTDTNERLTTYELIQIGEYGYIKTNEDGDETGQEIGKATKEFIVTSKEVIETFRQFYGDSEKYSDIDVEKARKFYVEMELSYETLKEHSERIKNTMDDYSRVLNSSWRSNIEYALTEHLKIQDELLSISKEIYKDKQQESY